MPSSRISRKLPLEESLTHQPDDLSLAPGEITRLFVSLGLARPEEIPEVRPLTGGVSSSIARIEFASGTYCLKQALAQLRTAKVWKVPVERVFAEIDWLRTAGTIVPGHVPRVLGVDEATKSFVMEFLGDGYRNWKADLLSGTVDATLAAQVGDVLGRIHAGTAHDPQIAERFATDSNFHAIRLEPYLEETARVHPTLAPTLNKLVLRTQQTKIALVHGDLSPKNILIGPNGPVILDAECAWYGDPAFDLAFCLNHFLMKMAWLPGRRDALDAAYLAMVTSYCKRVDFEPITDLRERVSTLLPALALARVDGKSPAEYLDEPARLRVRKAALALLHKPRLPLEDIALLWFKELSA